MEAAPARRTQRPQQDFESWPSYLQQKHWDEVEAVPAMATEVAVHASLHANMQPLCSGVDRHACIQEVHGVCMHAFSFAGHGLSSQRVRLHPAHRADKRIDCSACSSGSVWPLSIRVVSGDDSERLHFRQSSDKVALQAGAQVLHDQVACVPSCLAARKQNLRALAFLS